MLLKLKSFFVKFFTKRSLFIFFNALEICSILSTDFKRGRLFARINVTRLSLFHVKTGEKQTYSHINLCVFFSRSKKIILPQMTCSNAIKVLPVTLLYLFCCCFYYLKTILAIMAICT